MTAPLRQRRRRSRTSTARTSERRMTRSDLTKLLTLRHMRVIAALDELKLVARVAESLNISQPAVSKQIAELERLVGSPLVLRERNRLFLTPIGARLAENARHMLSVLDRTAFDIEAMSSGISGSVTVGVVSSVAPIVLPGAVALFKRAAPSAGLTVIEGHFNGLLPQLQAGQVDLLIARTWQPQALEGIDQSVLLRENVVVVGGRDHPLGRQGAVDWAEAVRWPWILPHPTSVARQAMDAHFARLGLATPTNTLASLSLSLNLALMAELPALGLFPKSLAKVHAARGEIAILPLDTGGLLSEARCFWLARRAATDGTLSLFMRCLEQAADTREPFH